MRTIPNGNSLLAFVLLVLLLSWQLETLLPYRRGATIEMAASIL